MTRKGRKFKNYLNEFKLKVATERVDGVSLSALQKKYNIPNDSMMVRWTKKYKEVGMIAFEDKRKFTKEQIPTKGKP